MGNADRQRGALRASLATRVVAVAAMLTGAVALSSGAGAGAAATPKAAAPKATPAPAPAAPQQAGPRPQVQSGLAPTSFDGNLTDLTAVASGDQLDPGVEEPEPNHPLVAEPDPTAPVAASMPSTSASFEGLHFAGTCTGGSCGSGWPPDTVGDVGPNNYVQAVNTAIGVFAKDGTQQAAFTFNSLWSTANSGSVCDTNNEGDPTVVYDPMADRWIVADFGFTNTAGPVYECIAVSKTGDPVAGGWWLYPYLMTPSSFGDYPKMAIWPDGLYLTTNDFSAAGSYSNAHVYAFNRTALEAGLPLQSVAFTTSRSYFSLLPSNVRGALPPAGSPNYVVAESATDFSFQVWKFHVDWAVPSNSTFTGPTRVSQTSYTFTSNGVPQPGTTQTLDSLEDRLMMQAQYRNIGGTESVWVSHTVGRAPVGIQWAQLDVTGGTIAADPVQQQIYTNVNSDGLSRWMPSLAVDRLGDMAVGYSTASSTVYPSITYAGRLAGDPLNTLGQGESTLLAGSGSQLSFNRWGDYSAMSVDPVDDCTFWYTTEYYAATGTDWHTRIASFKYPGCKKVPTTPTISNLPASGAYGGSFLPTVTTTGDGATSVTSSTPAVCTVDPDTTVRYVGVGTCTLTAHVAAGATYASADGTPQSFSVGQATPSVVINIPLFGTYGDSYVPTFTTASDGVRSVTSSTPAVCTVDPDTTVRYVGVGTCTLNAHVAATTNYAAADGSDESFTVNPATPGAPSITNIPASPVYLGSFVPAVSTDGDGATSVTSSTPAVCTVSAGSVSFVGAGTCSLTAHVAAGDHYAAADGTEQSFSVAALVPDAPIIGTAAAGAGTVTLSWTAPASDGGSPITGYVVTPYVGAVAQAQQTFDATTTTRTLTGLDAATTYTFTVAATNGVGTGAPSAASNPVTTYAAPGAPSFLAVASLDGAARVAWFAPANHGSAITGYLITPYLGGVPQFTRLFPTAATSDVVVGLTNGLQYTFRVRAVNAAGPGPDSSPSAPVIIGVPGAPVAVSAVTGDGLATVRWAAAAPNGSPVNGYSVTPYKAGVAQAPQIFFSTATSQVVSGLDDGASYTFKVSAFNAYGQGPLSGGSSAIVVGVPGPPAGVSAVPGNGAATVRWTAPAPNAAPITSYEVTPYLAGVAQPVQAFASTATSQVVTGLTNGGSYTFKVAALNTYGRSLLGGGSTSIVVGVPGTPGSISARPGAGSAAVTWAAPTANGAPITGYVVTPYLGSVAQAPRTFASAATSQLVTGLTDGMTYTFKVAATNAYGTGPAGSGGSVRVGSPLAPTSVKAVAGVGQATVSWKAPAPNGTAAVTGYVVTPYVGSIALPSTTFASTATTQVITGLSSGTIYTFRVAAINAAGIGQTSYGSAAIIPT